jgi:hypothetical protein
MKRFKWTIEIEVTETWVADGFDMRTPEDVKVLLERRLPHAYGHELGGKVISRPPDKEVATAQGYKTVEAYRKAARK